MYAEIIATGDEITNGVILDTNSQWLSRELKRLGITVLFHTTVTDDLPAMVDVFRIAMSRVDLVISTGGLGPTADDLTRQALADAVGVPLLKDDESLRQIQALLQRRGGTLSPAHERQAFQPQGAVPIRNPNGTAPGVDLTVKRTTPVEGLHDFVRLMALPGVPAEKREMWHYSARQTLLTMLYTMRGGEWHIKYRAIHSFGLGESAVATMLSDLLERDHIPRVGISVTQATITLHIVAEGKTEEECDQQIEPTAQYIYEVLGDRIYGEGDDTLGDVVSRILNAQSKKVAVVEAGTRGLLAEAIASSAESATCFLGGVVVPPRRPIAPDKMIEIGHKMFDTADYFLLIGAYPEGVPDRTRSDETFVAIINAKDPNLQTSVLQMRNFPFVGHPSLIDDLYVKRVLDTFRRHTN